MYVCMHVCMNACMHACMYVCSSYNTPRRAVSDLQSPIPRAHSVRGGGDCKSDTAQLGVL